jgi:carboxylesterase type B
VRDNIHNFSGDKDKITIFGQSAGGSSVSAHVLSPMTKGLFKRAIISSGSNYHKHGQLQMSKEEALNKTMEVASTLNCTVDHWLSCLRNASAQELIKLGGYIGTVEGTEYLPLNAQQAFQQGKYNKGKKEACSWVN